MTLKSLMSIGMLAGFVCVLALGGCTRRIGVDELNETCKRRLGNRTALTSAQINKFCSCFIDASLKKYPASKLAHEFETGSGDMFKEGLRSEFNQCKAVAR